jgi:hypothetical protein
MLAFVLMVANAAEPGVRPILLDMVSLDAPRAFLDI